MQLTAHTDYALRLLLYVMSQAPRKVSTREAAEAFSISLNHLTKVAKALTRGGYLVSARGLGGGLQLAEGAEKKTVGEIVRFSETNCNLAECFQPRTNTCPITSVCRLKGVLHRAQQAFFSVLDGATLGDIGRNRDDLKSALARST